MSISKAAKKFFEEQGRIGGLKGGTKGALAAAANMTPEQRAERARKGGLGKAAKAKERAKANKKNR